MQFIFINKLTRPPFGGVHTQLFRLYQHSEAITVKIKKILIFRENKIII